MADQVGAGVGDRGADRGLVGDVEPAPLDVGAARRGRARREVGGDDAMAGGGRATSTRSWPSCPPAPVRRTFMRPRIRAASWRSARRAARAPVRRRRADRGRTCRGGASRPPRAAARRPGRRRIDAARGEPRPVVALEGAAQDLGVLGGRGQAPGAVGVGERGRVARRRRLRRRRSWPRARRTSPAGRRRPRPGPRSASGVVKNQSSRAQPKSRWRTSSRRMRSRAARAGGAVQPSRRCLNSGTATVSPRAKTRTAGAQEVELERRRRGGGAGRGRRGRARAARCRRRRRRSRATAASARARRRRCGGRRR